MHRECRKRFPRHRGLAIPTCITARVWRTCRDACRDRWLAVSFEVGGRGSVPGIPVACETRNFTYLVRGPWEDIMAWKGFPHYWPFVRGITDHRWSPLWEESASHWWILLLKGQKKRFLMLSLLSDWMSCWTNCRVAGDLRRHDVSVMVFARH